MFKKRIIYNRFAIALVLLLSPIFTLLTSSITHASSVYDNTIDKVSNIELHNSACTADPTDTIDYSSNWADQFISASSTLNYSGSAMTKTQAVTLFNNKKHWGISQLDTGSQKQLYIWWTDAASQPIEFMNQSTPSGSLPQALIHHTSADGGTFAFLVIVLDGGTSCSPRIAGSDYTTGETWIRVAYDDTAASSILGYTYKPWRQFTTVNYPSGYAGVQLNKEVSGTVICGWKKGMGAITNVYLQTSSGQEDNAIISYNATEDGMYYDYYMMNPSDTYHIYMVCDGQLGSGPSVNYSSDWACSYDDTSGTYLCYTS